MDAALEAAAKGGHIEVVEYLFDRSSDSDVKCALTEAMANGYCILCPGCLRAAVSKYR